MTAYTRIVESNNSFSGLAHITNLVLRHSEGLAVFIAAYLANETALPNINLLHLSSRKALTAALQMAEVFPHIDFPPRGDDRPPGARYEFEGWRAGEGQSDRSGRART
jgi:hypothetical protein